MKPFFRSIILLVALALLSLPGVVYAQTVGSDDYEAPDDSLPGEANVAPPVDDAAVHPSADERQPAATTDAELSDGDRSATIRVVHGADEDVDLAGLPVVLNAVRPPGLVQPDNFRQVISSWNAVTDENGIARFDNLPDGLSAQGLALQASTTFGGLSFDSDYTEATDAVDIDLAVFDRTHKLPPVRLSRKRVIISPWEEFLVVDQFWTIEVDGDHAFDIGTATDASLQRGLPLRLPIQAEGISFAGPGDEEIINNVIYWTGVLQPGQAVTFQIRFSESVRSSSYTFNQQMQYPVDEVQILVPIDTNFERISRLEDLTLRAPGFDVGSDPSVAGLPAQRDYLVASGRSVEAGETYSYRVEGLPFTRPLGGWIALIGGLLAAFFIAFYGRREYREFRDSQSQDDVLDALKHRRDAVVDELAEIELALSEFDETDDNDDILELEEEQTLLRQRLALILRKINDVESGDSPSSQAA